MNFSKNSAAALLLAAAASFLVAMPGRAEERPPVADQVRHARPKALRASITISRETTYITEPVDADGYIDYVAALNKRESEGVTPENNAAVLFWQAVGPSEIPANRREQFFRQLGIAPPSDAGDYFVTLSEFATHPQAPDKVDLEAGRKVVVQLNCQLDEASPRPWSSEEFPFLARWLSANEKPLAVLFEASRRTRRFDPLLPNQGDPQTDNMPIGSAFAAASAVRQACFAFRARAMLRLQAGETAAAWSDVLTCQRLCRLIGSGPSAFEAFMAFVLASHTTESALVILQNARLSKADILSMRADLEQLPTLPIIWEKIEFCERFRYLECIAMAARGASGDLTRNRSQKTAIETAIGLAEFHLTNWDQVLRTGNHWFDRHGEASRLPTHAQRQAAFIKLVEDFDAATAEIADWRFLVLDYITDPRQAFSKRKAHHLFSLLEPPTVFSFQAKDRAVMLLELNKLAFTLAAYRADHGTYPTTLAELAPRYLAKVPVDLFTDEDLRYLRHDEGYLLYSVGVNEQDDGGKSFDGREDEDAVKNQQAWDDLAVRVPVKPRVTP